METNMSRMIRSAAIAILFASVPGLAMAQSAPADQGFHNSTTGAAPTDQPNPPLVLHIPSGSDAAKFNAATGADDKKPTMAHVLALTDAQRQLISSSLAGGKVQGSAQESSGRPDFKPEVAALMPKSAKVQDLPGEVTAKMPWVAPYKYAVVDDKILLVDPVNSFMVVDILNR
jgi:hypothetical protein